MDVAGLRDRIQATLDANAAIRQQAELDLKFVRSNRLPPPVPRLHDTDWSLGRGQAWLH